MTTSHTQAKPTNVRWAVMGLLFVIAVIAVVDRVNVAIAAKYIMAEHHLSQVQMGWIFSAFVAGYAISAIPGGWLADRFGSRKVLAWAMVAWSGFTVLTALSGELFTASLFGTVASFMILRLLVGLGEGAGPPNYPKVVANWLPARESGRGIGIVWAGSALGNAVTPPLVVWIMMTWGWRYAFYSAGVLGLIVALIWYLTTRDRADQHPIVNDAEKAWISAEPAAAAGEKSAGSLRKVLASREVWLLSFIAFNVAYINYFFFSWLFIYLVDVRHFSIVRGSFVTILPFLGAAAASPLGGWISDRLSKRYGKRIGRSVMASFCCVICALAIVGGALAVNTTMAVALLTVGASLAMLSSSLVFIAIVDVVKSAVSTASGLVLCVAHIGGALAPTVTPIVAARYGWPAALILAASLAVVAAAIWLFVKPTAAQVKPSDAAASLVASASASEV